MAKKDEKEPKGTKKSTLEWLEYYVNKARSEGYDVQATAHRLVQDDENHLGETEGKTL